MATTTQTVAITSGGSTSMAAGKDPAGFFRPVYSLDERGAGIYRASANFTPQATAAVTVISFKGIAASTIRIRKIMLQQLSTTVGQGLWALQRTTALGAGGTAGNPTYAKLDSGSAAPGLTSTNIAHYTSTLKAAGTSTDGPMSTFTLASTLAQGSTPTALSGPQMVQVWPEPGGMWTSIVLRGTGDILEIQNVNAGNLAAGTTLTYSFEWEEDGS